MASLILLPISIGAPLLYIPLQRHYLLSNLIALCLATSTLGLLKLDSFLTAIVLLSALLVYDIFWVS
jgi:minor histocompatibility antigen H13